MPNKVKLSALCSEISYGYTASANNESVGPKFLRITDIQGGVVDWSDVPYCEIDQNKLEKNVLLKGDIVVARTGNSTGENYIFDSNIQAVFASYLIKFRVDPKLANPYFVWLQMRTQSWWSFVSNSKSGSAQAGANAKVLGLFEVELPERKIQDETVDIVFNYFKKIEVNKQTNQTLEQMAQTLFKSWFVDFDPVLDNLLAKADFNLANLENTLPEPLFKKAKARLSAINASANTFGNKSADKIKASLTALIQSSSPQLSSRKVSETDAKSASILPQHANTHAHFPSEFEHNEQLGWIPKGWEVGSLESVAKFTLSRINGEDLSLDNYISTDNMHANKKGVYKATKLPEVKTTPAFHAGHILISNIRPYFKKIWLATSSGGRSNDVLGFESVDTESKEYVFNLLYQDMFFDYMMTTSKGSKMPRGDKKAIMDWAIVIPPNVLQKIYSKFVEDFYRVISVRNKEIVALTKIRDALLPKLISGEITLPDSQISSEA